MHVRKKSAAFLTAVALGGGLFGALGAAGPAQAICDGPKVQYIVNHKAPVWIYTGVAGPWAKAPADASLSRSKSVTTNYSSSVNFGTEAGVIFAKVKTDLSISVGKAYTNTDTWSVSKPVPKKKWGRMKLYQRGYGFQVTKKQLTGDCTYRTTWVSKVRAPKKTNESLVSMQVSKTKP